MDRDQEPERYYDWMLWKLRQENPNWYSSDPKYEGERLVTKDNPNHQYNRKNNPSKKETLKSFLKQNKDNKK